jgi:predicted ATP-binding protein involved in virulence
MRFKNNKKMRIEKIEIGNFRGFKGTHTLVCQPRLNVFVGVNGAGKSSLLDLIGMFLNEVIFDILGLEHNPFKMKTLGRLDINNQDKRTYNSMTINFEVNDFLKKKTLEMTLSSLYDSQNKPGVDFSSGHVELSKTASEIENQKINLPIFRDFHLKRRWKDGVVLALDEFAPPQYFAYNGAFDSIESFDSFSEWFRLQEDYENREIIQTKNMGFKNPVLEPVRRAFDVFFNNFNAVRFTDLRVENDKKVVTHHHNDLCVNKNGVKFFLSQLSSGEQTTFLMIADIAQRLSMANPNLEDALHGTGIVLIDEIDIHLHPEWQREVIPALMLTFPNIQFFITTHSPQVLSNIDRKNIIVIEDFEFKQSAYTLGKDTNSILNHVFGVAERPQKYQKAFNELYDLIDNPNKISAAKSKLHQMMLELGPNDTEIERAKMHFEFLTEEAI